MTLRGLLMVSLAVLLAMACLACLAWSRLPADAMLPVHWNGAGQIDRVAPAARALAMPVLVAAGVTLLFAVIPLIEPLQQRMDRSMALYRVGWLGILAVMALVEITVALPAFGLASPGILPVSGVGLFFVLLGNALPKSRPSFFVGIRTPWTLSDAENWIATHRLGGRTMMLGGLMLILTPLLPVGLRIGWTFSAIGVAVIPPIFYSWWFWHRRARGRAAE